MTKQETLRPLMFVGTGSDVGKSVLTAAFGRLLLQEGYRPAPFKAQNMSLNSGASPEGLEMGRAQVVQAEACGISPSVHMNPILLKPTGDKVSQLVLLGKPAGDQSAQEYFNRGDRDALFEVAMQSCHRLMERYSPLLIEGAGSISEVNLWDRDITNLRVAEAVDAAVILVADIDRGGVFGSVYGSIQLLPPKYRRLIKGILINKFRGDAELFEDGRSMLEELTGVPVIGVVPYFRDIFIEQEDSVVLDHMKQGPQEGKINVGVVALPHMSNFTDFDTLQQVEEVQVFYLREAKAVKDADIVLLPGSKSTIADLLYLRQNGMEAAILQHHQSNKPLYGICGGFQMMGQSIADPQGVEGAVKEVRGMGILPVKTVLGTDKKTEVCRFHFLDQPTVSGRGYEIHMGRTTGGDALCRLDNGSKDGARLNARCWGTYIHGILDNEAVLQEILQIVRPGIRIRADYAALKEKGFDQLADLLRRHIDLPHIYQLLQK